MFQPNRAQIVTELNPLKVEGMRLLFRKYLRLAGGQGGTRDLREFERKQQQFERTLEVVILKFVNA